ncbi:DNA translocase FtsK [Virgibacillus senegalensis]|uniref:DNA translocase FtsK n=1 Tax=Virgibacillus senegalensis TaxID=1499679 RepID=UPI00069F9491|nr:DNA translocase FtsK [Virgibacillus senegalensis]
MWEQLKRKFKQLLAEEEPEIESVPQETNNNANKSTNGLHTRVSYQYPKSSSFKFPMIPDKKDAEEESRPAYERRKPEKNLPDDKPEVKKRNEKAIEREQRKPNVSKIQPEEGKQPFKPTEVPSPIYGFRQEKKITETPAFMRKQKDNLGEKEEKLEFHQLAEYKMEEDIGEKAAAETGSSDSFGDTRKPAADNSWDTNSAELEKHLEEKDLTIAEVQSLRLVEDEREEPESPARTVSELSHDVTESLKEEEHATPVEEKEEKDEDNGETSAHYQESMDEAPRQQKEEQIKPSKTEVQKSLTPFNVIMTPRDKRNRFRKEKEAPAVQEKPTGPPNYLLNDPIPKSQENRDWVNQQIELLEMTLAHFHVKAKVVNAMSGPSVTRFEVQPELGVKVSKIKNLSDDIKLNMAARDIRMEAPIPGKNAIGIEVPNPKAQAVGLQEIFTDEAFRNTASPLSVALGLDIAGKPIVTDLQKMPHGLIAGATGSGKSVCINTILISLLYKASHKDVRFLLIDPKMVELAPYNNLPHLVSPVITDVKAATSALKWAVAEMEERYEKFVKEGVRDVERYNLKMRQQQREEEHLPYLVIVIDELADLMMVSPQDVEDAICRIAQKARACGIHLLLATQRPSVDVITGLIKANIPTRIAFSVSSQVDSRTIIDTNGAEKLLGRGDMLFLENGSGQSVRIQGAFVSDEEIERVTNYVRKLAPPNYLFEQEQLLEQVNLEEEEDELYNEAVAFVLQQNGASASLLQRRFKIGYNRAARLIDYMESHGIISEQKGSKPRDVLITSAQAGDYLAEDSYK